MSDPYSIAGGGSGRLKLKGVKEGKIDKHSKKKKHKHRDKDQHPDLDKDGAFHDNSVVPKSLVGDQENEQGRDRDRAGLGGESSKSKGKDDSAESGPPLAKTEAERRYEEQRRKRLEERLRKEGGAKTHKQRVEELNRYLSGLSEHHDMPKIGPG
ncbi:hypothetical protein DV737_g5761, partial [Chaetothyriales sp. CBS 132003]